MEKAKNPDSVVKLNLEDKGQDFLWFIVHGNLIIATGPSQGWLWNERRLTASTFAPGDVLTFADDFMTLKYKVVSVEDISKR